VLTRDNLSKRRPVDDPTCLFCSEIESGSHLFFHCCVAKALWAVISEIIEFPVGAGFESVAKLWIREKKIKIVNTCTTAVIWTLRKYRNEMCFQVSQWCGMQTLMRRCAGLLKNWRLLCKEEDAVILEQWAVALEKRSTEPPRLTLEYQRAQA
jgi:hypothetical protein